MAVMPNHLDPSAGGGPSCQWPWLGCQWRLVTGSYSHGAGTLGSDPLGEENEPPAPGSTGPPAELTRVIAQPVIATMRTAHSASLILQPI